MIGLGILLLVIGIVLLIVCAAATLPAVAHTIGVILAVLGCRAHHRGFPAARTAHLDGRL